MRVSDFLRWSCCLPIGSFLVITRAWRLGVKSEGRHEGRGGGVVGTRLHHLCGLGVAVCISLDFHISRLTDYVGVHEALFCCGFPLLKV